MLGSKAQHFPPGVKTGHWKATLATVSTYNQFVRQEQYFSQMSSAGKVVSTGDQGAEHRRQR